MSASPDSTAQGGPLPSGSSGRSAFDVAEAAVRAAGAEAMSRFEGASLGGETRLHIFHKGRNDVVTDADRAAETASLSVLRGEFPGFGVLAEESGSHEGTSEYRWILDPIDGTRNFASGIPHFAVNLALARGDEVVLAVTYDPVREELFHALLGGGAYVNGTPILVSTEPELEKSVLGFDMGYVDEKGRWLLEMLLHLWPGMQTIRIMGTVALGMAYTAAGRLQFYAHHHVLPWDVAPGLLLVREAGGIVTDHLGAPATVHGDCVVAAPPALHARFMEATEGLTWRTSG